MRTIGGLMVLAGVLVGCADTPESPLASDLLPVVCVQKLSSGQCGPTREAFVYDYGSNSCRAVRWGGCGGNPPFTTLADCLRACRGGP